MAQLVKTLNGLAIASVKTVNGLAIASVKTINGLDNTAGGGGGTIGPISIAADADNGEVWSGFLWTDGENNDGVGHMYFAGANHVWCFYRFELSAAIPSGATIDSALLELWGEGNTGWSQGTNDLIVRCTDSADAPAPTSGGERPAFDGGSTAITTATVAWDNVTWAANAYNTSPNLATMIQELVDDYGGLASGAGICLWVATIAGLTARVQAQLREFTGEDNVAKLTIQYS